MANYHVILYSLLLLHSILLGAFLVKQGRLLMLRIFLFVFAFHMGLNLLENWLGRDFTTSVAPVLAQLYGPSLFLFFKELMFRDFQLEKSHLVHLLPAGLAITMMIVVGPGGPVEFVLTIPPLLYLLAALASMLKFHREIKDSYSDPWGARLNWMVVILLGFLAGGVLDGIARSLLSPVSFAAQALHAISMVVLLATLTAMVWKAMNHPRVLANALVSPGNSPSASIPIDDDEIEAFREKLEKLFATHALHLKPRLAVAEVAEHLRLSPREVSRLIKASFEQNFSDFVNARRVEAVIVLIENPDQAGRSLLQIAFDAGFNSKTAFHDSFKKEMGTTPAAWRKQNKARAQNIE